MRGVIKFVCAIILVVLVVGIVILTNKPSSKPATTEPTTAAPTTTEKPVPVDQGPLTLEEAIDAYKTDDTEICIDISRYQGVIDWEEVKNSGVSYVYIRLGVQDGFGGKRYGDKKYDVNIKGAIAAGLNVGVYYHSCALTVEDAEKDAQFVLSRLSSYTSEDLALPIAFDWESWEDLDSKNTTAEEMSETLNECYKAFSQKLSEKGYATCLYSSAHYLNEGIWEQPDNLWIAEYKTFTTYEGDYFIWQCCNEGTVPGITEVADINVLYMDKLNEIIK